MSLREAVIRVIEQNRSKGCTPHRFISMTKNGNAQNLAQVCEKLLTSPDAFEQVEKAIRDNPELLTLEDEVANSLNGFGLSNEAVEQARARVEFLNRIRRGKR